jgi:replicative DNA helicase
MMDPSQQHQHDVATIEMEQALLGVLLTAPNGIDRVRGIVDDRDFLEPLHAHIFRVLCERRDAGEGVTITLMAAALGQVDLGGVRVREYLSRMMTHSAISVLPDEQARAVRRARQVRSVIETAIGVQQAMAGGSAIDDPTPRLREAIEAFDGIVNENAAEHMRPVSLGAASRAAIEAAQNRAAGRAAKGVPFGIPSLDKATHGIQPGQLVVLAGRPGMGKSTVALHFTMRAAAAGWGVFYASLEMNGEELAQRAMAATLYDEGFRVAYQTIAAGTNLSDTDLYAMLRAEEAYRRMPVRIDPTPGLTVAQITGRARRFRSELASRGVAMGVLVVDHLGLIRSSDRYRGNRVNEIAEITGALKTFAREMQIGIVLCSQLNRAVEHKPIAERRPSLADLRDSGSIEQDADVVLALFREAHYLGALPDPTPEEAERLRRVENRLEIEILKQRQGPTMRVECFCDIGFNVVGEMANG